MAARLAAPAQSGGGSSPSAVRELIVIPDIGDSMQLQHIHQVSSSVVEVNGDSSGQSSPNADGQHTFIVTTVPPWDRNLAPKSEPSSDPEKVGYRAVRDAENERVAWETSVAMEVSRYRQFYPCEGGNGVNYHVQYVTEPQEIYTQGHQMETLRYPVYGVATVAGAPEPPPEPAWGGASGAEYTAYGLVVAGDEAEAPASPATPGAAPAQRMPPATVQWLLDHYETAEGVSLPRSTLYAHYLRHCSSHRLEPVNAASFGKLIRSVFVGLRTRRLGTRGNSKYHYYGIRAKPMAYDRDDSGDDKSDGNEKQEERPRSERSESTEGRSPTTPVHRQYLSNVSAPEPPDLNLSSPDTANILREQHREYGQQFLAAAAALDAAGVEAARRRFWRAAAGAWRNAGAARRGALRRWLRAADTALYQRAAALLLPDVLRPLEPQLTQAIRNFAKSVEAAITSGSSGAPRGAVRAGGAAGGALAAALRRYTSLNHLAQAARAVLTNHAQIHQMVSDLSRVDFRVVREQAGWACGCAAHDNALRLEADFKATLSRGASLEAWAEWLESCVRAALPDTPAATDDTPAATDDTPAATDDTPAATDDTPAATRDRARVLPRARRLLLHWSFYCSLVIRELTLRSAASFGSFHLLRLLYDEYVSYLVERRVAAALAVPPIAVMYLRDDEDSDDAEDGPKADNDDDDRDWEWDDDEDDEDDPPETKKSKLND